MNYKLIAAAMSCLILTAGLFSGCRDQSTEQSPSPSPTPTVTATPASTPTATPKATASAYPNATPEASPKSSDAITTKTIIGIYTGRVDNNSIEITLEDDFEVLHLNEETRKMLEDGTLVEGDSIKAEFTINEKTGERTILKLEVVR